MHQIDYYCSPYTTSKTWKLNLFMYKEKKAEKSVLFFLLIVLLCSQSIGIFLFSMGFFPQKKTLEGYNTPKDIPGFALHYKTVCIIVFNLLYSHNNSIIKGHSIKPKFDRLVIMVVDAMRSDLLYNPSSPMNFTKSLIMNGQTYPFIAYAHAPTVTLPRIKVNIFEYENITC